MNLQKIKSLINEANHILVLPSQPADIDCLTSALVIKWYLTEICKKDLVRIYSFFQIPDKLKIFPEIQEIEQKYLEKVDLSFYDLIIGVDGNAFERYLTNGYKKNINVNSIQDKFVVFDHHPADSMGEFNHDIYIFDSEASSATCVIYQSLFADLQITPQIATWLYAGLSGDTGNFKWNITSESLKIAGELLEKGADYLKATSINVPKKEIDFTIWALQKTQYLPELKTTLLSIEKSNYPYLDQSFGDKWDFKDLDRHYKNSFTKIIEGYDFYFILKEDKNADNVRITWRSRDLSTNAIDFIQIFKKLGFEAGGHMNSGSARAYGVRINDVWNNLQHEISKRLVKKS